MQYSRSATSTSKPAKPEKYNFRVVQPRFAMEHLEQPWSKLTSMKKWASIIDLYLDVVSTLDTNTGSVLITFKISHNYGIDLAPTCHLVWRLADDTPIPVVLCSKGIHPCQRGGS
jgi:hypothetical protein